MKNVVSWKLKGFEQSYFEAKLASPKSTLTKPHHRDANITFCETFIISFLKNFEKKHPKETSYLENYQKLSRELTRKLPEIENYKDLSNHSQRKYSQPLRVPSQYPTTGMRSSTFWNLLKFLNIFWKNHKKRHISKKTRTWEARFGGKIRNSWEHPHNIQQQEWDLQRFGNF